MFWPDPNRRLVQALDRHTAALNANTKGLLTMAVNTAALTQAMIDLKAAAGVAATALDDLAAKIAAIPVDTAGQAAVDDAVAQANAIRDNLNAVAAKDDPQTPAA